MSLRIWISRCLALGLYAFSRLFYRFEVSWVEPPPPDVWENIRVFAFMNHTSLLEPLFLGAFPVRFLMDAACRTTVPGADKTMNRPIVGRFYKYFTPHTVSITRKRDDSWEGFLEGIGEDSLVAIAPEGRMKRPNGLDANGQPMSVRGGIGDILSYLQRGKMLIAYSGGLHHVNQPGERRLRLFKTLRIRFEILEIESYLAAFSESDQAKSSHLRKAIARDLEARQKQHQPKAHGTL